MKKKIVIIILGLVVVLGVVLVYNKVMVKKETNDVLPDKIVENFGRKSFPGARWGGLSLSCEDGGFDILKYAGKKIITQKSPAPNKFYGKIPLDDYKIFVGNEMICELYADSSGMMAPGIFAINDLNIKSDPH